MPLVTQINPSLKVTRQMIPVIVDRHTLQKRRWRKEAADGTDIAVDLESPCSNGVVVFANEKGTYVIQQVEEPVIEISLPTSPGNAARLGWFLGNQHLQVEMGGSSIRLADTPHLQDLLARAGIAFENKSAVFSPDPHSKTGHHHH